VGGGCSARLQDRSAAALELRQGRVRWKTEEGGRRAQRITQSRSLPARGFVGLEVHRCLCIVDAENVFISTEHGQLNRTLPFTDPTKKIDGISGSYTAF
jgi:hypothetical protein